MAIFVNQELVFQLASPLPPCQHNVAEYSALLMALHVCSARDYDYPKIYSDSNVVVNQVNRKWGCHSDDLKPFLFSVRTIQASFPFHLSWLPRKFLRIPDGICNKFLDAVDMLDDHHMDLVVAENIK